MSKVGQETLSGILKGTVVNVGSTSKYILQLNLLSYVLGVLDLLHLPANTFNLGEFICSVMHISPSLFNTCLDVKWCRLSPGERRISPRCCSRNAHSLVCGACPNPHRSTGELILTAVSPFIWLIATFSIQGWMDEASSNFRLQIKSLLNSRIETWLFFLFLPFLQYLLLLLNLCTKDNKSIYA